MALSSGGYGHSGERSNSGRKRKYEEQNDCGKNHKRIYLESRIFQSWLQAKAMNLAATATSRLRLLIVEGKLCLHNSFYLHKYLCVLL